jgi:hypothetical protein
VISWAVVVAYTQVECRIGVVRRVVDTVVVAHKVVAVVVRRVVVAHRAAGAVRKAVGVGLDRYTCRIPPVVKDAPATVQAIRKYRGNRCGCPGIG